MGQKGLFTLDLKRRRLGIFSPDGLGTLPNPTNIFIEPDGTKYIVDFKRRQVVVFGPDNSYRTALGGEKDFKPGDVVVSGGRVYVSDIKKHQIRVYDKRSGKLLFTFGKKGGAEGEFHFPVSLGADGQGDIYVSDMINFRLQKFDRDGKFLMTIGRLGDRPGGFSRPKGVAVDREGLIYVVDAGFNNVQIFNQKKDLMLFFGGLGNLPGRMYLPAKVVIDYDHVKYFEKYADPDFEIKYLVIVTNQFGSFPVSVFGFGGLKPGAQIPEAPKPAGDKAAGDKPAPEGKAQPKK